MIGACRGNRPSRRLFQEASGLPAREQGGFLSIIHRIVPISLLAAMACAPPPEERHSMPGADPAHGLAVIERAGCGACHTIPGLGWPQGRVAPELAGIAEQTLIAGELPNRPDMLAAFVRNAPAMVPQSTMPAMPISEDESRDVAAYLYSLGNR